MRPLSRLMPAPARRFVSGLTLSVALMTGASSLALADRVYPGEEAIVFEAGENRVDAYRGVLSVPENRADPESRMIELVYVRFPATTDEPGDPIVYLSGGPGGSGISTARFRRFDLFMQMREHGDVIAYDQRGTGESNDMPNCESGVNIPLAEVTSDAELGALYRDAALVCRDFWDGEGIDINAYNTRESVRDLSDLRTHLEADQLTLWGISYGSHLSLAALKDIEDEIGHVIIASVEGLDQTVKSPARTDAYFARLQTALETQPAAHARYGDIATLMRRVHARLDEEPMLIMVPRREGEPVPYLLQRRNVQQFASGMISDPRNVGALFAMYAELDQGGSQIVTAMLQRFFRPSEEIMLRPMSTAMDVASGVNADDLARFETEAETSLLGLYLNFPMPQLNEAWDGLDLGDEFRTAPVSDVPVLVLSGTLDGRTYVESQAEAVAGLENAQIVTVHNAGHNLFMMSDEVQQSMHAFLRGEDQSGREIIVDLPDFNELPF